MIWVSPEQPAIWVSPGGKGDLGQPRAGGEGMSSDVGEPRREGDLSPPRAALEGGISDLGEPSRESDLGQPRAAEEGLLSDMGESRREAKVPGHLSFGPPGGALLCPWRQTSACQLGDAVQVVLF